MYDETIAKYEYPTGSEWESMFAKGLFPDPRKYKYWSCIWLDIMYYSYRSSRFDLLVLLVNLMCVLFLIVAQVYVDNMLIFKVKNKTYWISCLFSYQQVHFDITTEPQK